MTPAELARVRRRLVAFAAEVFEPLARADQRRWGEVYLRGLMLDGKRKSIQPMAERLLDGNEQALQQFVSQSPWDWRPVRQRLARQLTAVLDPDAWVVDDTGFPKYGTASAGSPASTPAPWARWPTARLACQSTRPPTRPAARSPGDCFSPRAGMRIRPGDALPTCPSGCVIDPSGSWRWTWWTSLAAGGFTHRWWSPTPAMGSRGSCAWGWRRAAGLGGPGQGHDQRLPGGGRPAGRPVRGAGPPPWGPLPRQAVLAGGAGHDGWPVGGQDRRLARRDQSQAALAVCGPAGPSRRRQAAPRRRRWGATGALAAGRVAPDQPEPTKYWLASLPDDTPLVELVRLAKLRWRIEHDYRELKDGLGLDHFEGRSFAGWHHHVTLVSAAHALSPCSGWTQNQPRRPDHLPGIACAASPARLLGRRLSPLPAHPAPLDPLAAPSNPSNLTKHY
jgi:DDE superfamily endonuclease/Transposase DDE domain